MILTLGTSGSGTAGRPRPHLRWSLAVGAALALGLQACGGGGPVPQVEGSPGAGEGAPRPVVLDGDLEEWAGVPILVSDEGDPDGPPVIDLESLSATDDPAWLFLRLDMGRVLNLQAMAGTVTLMVDADDDPRTGGTVEGMAGVEFAVDLSPRRDPGSGGYGAGFALRLPDGTTRSPYDVGLAGLPTYAADRFELRLMRRPRGGLSPLGQTVRLGVVARAEPRDSAGGPGPTRDVDRLRATRYRLGTDPGPDPFEPELGRLAPPGAGAFRVAVWNVGSETFRDVAAFARALGLVRPDVILLDEVYEEVSPAKLEEFFAQPGLDSLGGWSFVVSRGGGRQKTVVAARNRGVRQEPGMVEVSYAPGSLDALRDRTPAAFHRALAYEARVNLSATGAWVEVDPEGAPGREVLFVPLDLQSGGWSGSPQDELRLLQARTLMDHLREATREAPGPREGSTVAGVARPAVVVAGDLNLVGGRGPLEVFLADSGTAFGPLAPAPLPRLDEATWATWLSEGQALFGPGRLDFTLYSTATLEQVGGFVLGSAGLSDGELASLGTDREAVAQLEEDHLPMVVDFRLRRAP